MTWLLEALLEEKERLERALEAALIGDLQGALETLIGSEARAASEILDWIGVAADLTLSQRVRWLALELATKQGYTLDEAERLVPAAYAHKALASPEGA